MRGHERAREKLASAETSYFAKVYGTTLGSSNAHILRRVDIPSVPGRCQTPSQRQGTVPFLPGSMGAESAVYIRIVLSLSLTPATLMLSLR